jgi:hypothetical protein
MRNRYIGVISAVFTAGFVVYGNTALFALAYITVFVFVSARTIMSHTVKKIKICLITAYLAVVVMQLTVCATIVFADGMETRPDVVFRKLFGLVMLLLPLFANRYVSSGKHTDIYLPSAQDAATVSFAEINALVGGVVSAVDIVRKTGKSLSVENIKTVIGDLPRHDSFRYINNMSLTPAYFVRAEESLDDGHIYIIISNTGSSASEIISVFTQKKYNHASLSFDRDLNTIISYNGGERVYPPGLNSETLEFFRKKEDASILVYAMPCARGQKRLMLDKIAEINREGSAYNMMGLFLKYSYKPNIMFCSQFVYKMLQIAGLAYFAKKDGAVTPMDLIEMDYYKKLTFVNEIKLNDRETPASDMHI